MAEGKPCPVDISRAELYQKVWETPMYRLAQQYGITGNGLAKICKRLQVPYPPRGYWAKKAAGKRVNVAPLPKKEPSTPESTKIVPTSLRVKPVPGAQREIEAVKSRFSAVSVPKRLNRPHPIIAKWLADHARRKKESRMGSINFATPEFTACERRQHRILHALFKTLEKHGGKVKEDDSRVLYAEMKGEPIHFQLREKRKQVRRPLSASERVLYVNDEKRWRMELVPTGILVFKIKNHIPGGLKTEWIETENKSMEELLPEILAVFVSAGPLLAQRRKELEEAQRRRRLEEQRRYEEAQQIKLDNYRWRRFVELARNWRECKVVRQFLEELKMNTDPGRLEDVVAEKNLAEWLSWAEDRLAAHDPLNWGSEGVFSEIGKVTRWSYND